MKIKHAVLSLTLSLLALSSLHADVDEVAIYLKPSQKDQPVEYLPVSHKAIKNAQPVGKPSSTGAQWYKSTWDWDAYADFSSGYVPKSALKKDGTFAPGTSIYLRKDTGSSVVAQIKPTDNVRMVDEGDWIAVDIDKNTTVYFQKGLGSHKNEILAQLEREATEKPSTIEDTPTTQIAQQTQRTTAQSSTKATTRHFEGILKQYASFLPPRPKYRYVLTDQEGQQLAFIDTQELLLDRPINNYHNEHVMLLGDVFSNDSYRKESIPLIIQAKTIRHM